MPLYDSTNLSDILVRKYHKMLNHSLNRFSRLVTRFKWAVQSSLTSLIYSLSYLPSYYRINDLMWQDGLLIDFLQKKVADKWIRRFLVCSSYLYSERVLFKFVVRFYIDYVVWPLVSFSIFEYSNVSLLLAATLTALTTIILLFNLNYLYVILFI
jgi:hypothetical protein